MEEDQDIIVIELGVKLSDEQYEEVLNSVMMFMDVRWPDFRKDRFKN